jgi:oligopeptide/dipeptide ABC transporter ATP-binding protein
LDVNHLTVDFVSVSSRVRVLNDASIQVEKGDTVGIVGESGSGKTTLGLAILGLLDSPPAQIAGGSIIFDGVDMMKLSPEEQTRYRGTGINMVFQESAVSLNPVYNVASQVGESLEVVRKLGENDGVRKEDSILRMLSDLCLDDPKSVMKKYPHELSGGMRKRVSIGMSIIQKPRLLILDEPTTGLDAYVQNRILSILRKLNRDGITMILITHDLEVASRFCNRLYVMYAGRIMEHGSTEDILADPLHPYTKTLLASIPNGDENSPPIPVPTGEPPDIGKLPTGCKFNPRCPLATQRCIDHEPPLFEKPKSRLVSCWLHEL